MAIETALRRLSLRPSSSSLSSSICHQCRRTLIATAVQRKEQSAAASIAESLTTPSRTPGPSSPRTQILTTPSGNTPPPPTPNAPHRTTSEPSRLVPRSSYEIASSNISELAEVTRRRQAQQREQALTREYSRADLEKQMPRRWKAGDVYAPHDLTGLQAAKWKKLRRGNEAEGKGRRRMDVVDLLGMNPLTEYKNFAIMSEYMTDMGRIKHRNETGLRPVNQRKMAKAIRRAVGIGLMPGVHRHPEILRIEMNERRRRP